GRFGPYLQFAKSNVSIPKGMDIDQIDMQFAVELIQKKKEADAPIHHYEGSPVTKGKGRFGPFIKWNNIFINVNKKYDFDNLSEQDIVTLIEEKKQKEKEKLIHNWENEGITVEKGRWGKVFVISGKKRKQLDAKKDPKALTLEEAKTILKS
ncbi:MAG: topoisomerase C-terminal repeat-containing protein, partial [Bacteroidota bacterium]|nr:topoisomerase C-terminal repeat-containing protein [Bacteroidota bacterium]